MLGLDERIAELGEGGLVLALLVALLLGLRHATDPDHLTAVSTLALGERAVGARRAGWLGAAWGIGHACTLVAVGLPLVLLGHELPQAVASALELAVGVVIVALAVRLLLRWRRGELHTHPHRHGDVVHAHPHVHEHGRPGAAHAHGDHSHPHGAETLARGPRTSFAVGLLHGAGGSAGVAVLVVASMPGRAASAAALAVLAAGTAIAMALVTAAFGALLARGATAPRLEVLAPGFGTAGLVFGCWYALAAVGAVPYVL